MKRIFAALLAGLAVFSMAACSSQPSSSSEGSSSSEASTAQSVVSEASSEVSEVSSEVSVESSASASSEYYFADNVAVTEDVKIEITDWKVIPVGEEGNEYGEAPVIAFWYSTTNLSGKEGISPMTAWMAIFTAVQDNDPDMVNTLEAGLLPDQAYLDTQMAEIKDGGTVDCAVSYVLTDETTPVTLTATKGLLGEELGSQNFDIA